MRARLSMWNRRYDRFMSHADYLHEAIAEIAEELPGFERLAWKTLPPAPGVPERR